MSLVFTCRASIGALLLSAMLTTACTSSVPKSPEQADADQAAAARVYAALNADPVYYYRHVDVRVDDGVAQLSGYIWDMPALDRAKRIAASVPGVRRVVDQMELERGGTRGGGHSGSG